MPEDARPQAAQAGEVGERRNPLDLVFEELRGGAARPGARVPLPWLQHQVARHGLDPAMLQEAPENWESPGLLDWPQRGQEVGLVEDAWRTQACHLDSPRQPPTAEASRPRPVALVSLFDGLGTARLAVQDVLEELGCPQALRLSCFAETDPLLAPPPGGGELGNRRRAERQRPAHQARG